MQEEFIEEQCGRSGDESLPSSMADYSSGLAKNLQWRFHGCGARAKVTMTVTTLRMWAETLCIDAKVKLHLLPTTESTVSGAVCSNVSSDGWDGAQCQERGKSSTIYDKPTQRLVPVWLTNKPCSIAILLCQ